jgi:hypothetical protein
MKTTRAKNDEAGFEYNGLSSLEKAAAGVGQGMDLQTKRMLLEMLS